MKLALGTVQFGLDYGISNQQGQVSKSQVKDILTQAIALGIDTLDCAGAYGNSEQILGELKASENFHLISKIPALSKEQDSIIPFFEQSLANLQCGSIDTLLFHQVDNLLTHKKSNHFFSQLLSLKAQHLVNNIGVSLYNPEQLLAITRAYDIDKVQVPINIFDQRFITTDILQHCLNKNIKIHARSLFLQGLLFIEQAHLPSYFAPYKEKLRAFSDLAQHLSCSKLVLALALLAQELPHTIRTDSSIIEKIVVGVCNVQQLTEIVNAYQQAKELTVTRNELSSLADSRLGFINPSLWSV